MLFCAFTSAVGYTVSKVTFKLTCTFNNSLLFPEPLFFLLHLGTFNAEGWVG